MIPIPPRARDLAWAWAAALFLAPPAHSITIHVPGDTPTIAGALQASDAGDSGRGAFAPAGVYFTRFEAGGVQQIRKIVYLGSQ